MLAVLSSISFASVVTPPFADHFLPVESMTIIDGTESGVPGIRRLIFSSLPLARRTPSLLKTLNLNFLPKNSPTPIASSPG